MQQVIGLIEELRAAGIDVPPYPLLDAPLVAMVEDDVPACNFKHESMILKREWSHGENRW
ncbi:hypothetical protein ACSFBM_28315 [Variovorax sp. GB1R11]|uniref:hypothetical protein n=1 Tax=Variovorax sp. GB1R11 TaxID=3443741 RepID=UPI003F4662CD